MYREIIIKVLTNVPVFKDISKESIIKLANLALLSQFKAGDCVFREGNPGDCLYIIASGKVDILSERPGGEEVKLRTLVPGEVFGEMALLDGLSRSATVKVSEKAILFYINRTDFNLFLLQNPEASIKLIESLSRRLRDTNSRLKDTIDENENLKVTLRETFGSFGENSSPASDDAFGPFEEEYGCPNCNYSVKKLNVDSDQAELIKTDSDFCPHYKNINPIFYEVAVCSNCGYAFNDEANIINDKPEKEAIVAKLSKLSKPSDFAGARSLDQAIQTFYRAMVIHDSRNISYLTKADLCIKLAWLYRYKDDPANEKKYLNMALQRFKKEFEEGDFLDTQREIYLMYMIGQTNLHTGNTAESLKWFSAITQHKSKDQAPKLVEKARDQWQEIKAAGKKRS